jgi:hypothetical protein
VHHATLESRTARVDRDAVVSSFLTTIKAAPGSRHCARPPSSAVLGRGPGRHPSNHNTDSPSARSAL